ncbi:MAG: type III pantothenate kinase [Candidatus Marinimicrobia bacterium]|nr:type III pantothenate kinase [Candidatus Neomarinimicrobiota bacterium]
MILAMDIGNTDTTLGLFSNEKLIYDWRTTSGLSRTSDEYGVLINSFISQAKTTADDLSGVIISSVVPSLTAVIAHMSEKYLHQTALIVSSKLDLGIPILIDDPEQLGADRICNAVAGIRDYDTPLVVVDFGTATTFDVISSKGEYLGGIIAPGVETSANDLFRRAAKLPKIDFIFPENIIGKNSTHSMQSGIMNGAVAVVDFMISAIEKEMGEKMNSVSTGGFAHLITPKCASVNEINPHLTLEGLNYIYDIVSNK